MKIMWLLGFLLVGCDEEGSGGILPQWFPTIVVTPGTATFSAADASWQWIEVSNSGGETLVISQVDFEVEGDFTLVLKPCATQVEEARWAAGDPDPLHYPLRIEPGDSLFLTMYRPDDEASTGGRLVLHTNDRNRLLAEIPITVR